MKRNSLDLEILMQAPMLKRLEHVSMLGVLNKVFPHNMQNRLEHSLEAFYFMNMWSVNQKYLTRKEIKHLAADMLLHDGGHTPYSHELERLAVLNQKEMAVKLLNESKMSAILQVSNIDNKFLSSLLAKEHPLSAIAGSKFGIDKIAYVAGDSPRLGLKEFEEVEDLIENIRYDKKKEKLVLARGGEEAAVEFASRYVDLHVNKYFHPSSLANKRLLTRLMHTALHEDNNEINASWDTNNWQLWIDRDVDDYISHHAEQNEEIAMIWEDFNERDYHHVLSISPSSTYGSNYLRPDKLARLKSLSLEKLTEIENDISNHLCIPTGSIILAIDGNAEKAALPDIYLEDEGAYLFKDTYKSFANKRMDELRESLGGVHLFSNKQNKLNSVNAETYKLCIREYLSTILK